MRFLIVLTKAENWIEGVRLPDQPFMPEHAVYVQQAFDQGKIIMAGPFNDTDGGAIIIDANQKEEAIEFAENDPAVKNGTFSYQIMGWAFKLSKFENISANYGQKYIDLKHQVQKELGIIE